MSSPAPHQYNDIVCSLSSNITTLVPTVVTSPIATPTAPLKSQGQVYMYVQLYMHACMYYVVDHSCQWVGPEAFELYHGKLAMLTNSYHRVAYEYSLSQPPQAFFYFIFFSMKFQCKNA